VMIDCNVSRQSVIALFLITTIITLLVGLLPRGNYKNNWVEADRKFGTTIFKEFGYASGTVSNFAEHTENETNTRLDITLTLHEQNEPNFRVLLFIGSGCKDEPFIIGQWRSQLIIMQGCDFSNQENRTRLSHDMQPYLNQRTSVSVKINRSGAELQINDKSVLSEIGALYLAPGLSQSDGQGHVLIGSTSNSIQPIYVGNTPDGQHGWTGSIAGLSIHQTSQETGELSIVRDYQFSAYDGKSDIVDASPASEYLHIPDPGQFPTQKRLVKIPVHALFKNQLLDVLVNLFGFIPMGIVAALLLVFYLGLRSVPLLIGTMLVATSVSLFIEISQVYIAGRSSNMHDLLLNCLGAGLGFTVCYLLVIRRTSTKAPSSGT